MNKLVYGLIFTLLFPYILNGQEEKREPVYGVTLSGYVKTDFFHDTRQSSASTGIREGHFYLYPDNVLLDAVGNDLNANPSFHMLNIQTRVKADITAPEVFGAKTTGVIEAEFFGTSDADINGLRLRHSFLKLDWTNTSLVIGQTWHPMFPAECFPGTVSFNTGVPFIPFSRNPQIKLTRKIGILSLTLDAYGQRDFTSPGPEGNSNKYMRNSGWPGVDFQIKAPAGELFTAWAGIDFKTLRPELKSSANIESNSEIMSFSTFLTMKIKTNPVTVSMMTVYAQNATDIMMIGGYAVSAESDTIEHIKSFTNLNTASTWLDLSTNGKKLSFGLFTGFSKNLGSDDPIIGAIYGRGNNVDHLFRLSPRIIITQSKVTFAAEVENTVAFYGTVGSNGKVSETNKVNNLRILISAILKF